MSQIGAGSKKLRQLAGYTLVEVLTYVTVLGIIGSVITSMVLEIYKTQIIIEDRAQVNEDMRTLLKSIRDDMYLGDDVEVEPDGDIIITSSFSNPSNVRYFEQNNQVYRQEGADSPVAVTNTATEVREFSAEDISTPSSAGVIRLTLQLANYPQGKLKPEIAQQVTSTISLKFL